MAKGHALSGIYYKYLLNTVIFVCFYNDKVGAMGHVLSAKLNVHKGIDIQVYFCTGNGSGLKYNDATVSSDMSCKSSSRVWQQRQGICSKKTDSN